MDPSKKNNIPSRPTLIKIKGIDPAAMLQLAFILTCAIAMHNAHASSAEDAYISAVLGAGAILFLAIFIGIYKISIKGIKKMAPKTPIWLQRIGGIAGVLLFYTLWNIIAS